MNNLIKRNFLIKIILIGLVLQVFGSQALSAVKFEGIDKEAIEKVKKKFPISFKNGFSQGTADEVLRQIMITKDYENVSLLRDSTGQYVFKGTKVRTISKVHLSGNELISQREAIKILQLKLGNRFEKSKIIAAGQKLKEFYGKRGYFNTEVSVSFFDVGKNKKRVHFEVKENNVCHVKSIRVDSSNASLNNILKQRFLVHTDRPFTDQLLNKITKSSNKYFKTRRYLQAFLKQSEVKYNDNKTEAHLIYKIDHPYKYEIYFEGYNPNNRSLSDLFRDIDLSNFDKSTLSPARVMVEKVRSGYLNLGFANINLDYQIQEDVKRFKRRIKIKITEGAKVKIRRLKFTGHISRPSSYYADFVQEHSTDLVANHYYNRKDLQIGYDNLETELRNQGYLQAKIRSVRIDYNKKKDGANISVDLDEGPLTQIRKISYKGIQAFSKVELNNQLLVSNNSPLRLNKLEESLLKLKIFYQSHGFLEMGVTNEKKDLVTYNKSGTQAKIKFEIYEGPKIFVKEIRVEGTKHTHDSVILRESDIAVGDLLTPEKMLEAKGRLNKLGMFAGVEIDTLEKLTPESQRTLVIKVVEQKPGVFKIGSGVTDENQFTVRGYAGASYFWGSARAVSARAELSESIAQANYPEHKITSGYLEPFLFNTNWKGRVNVTRQVKVDSFNSETRVATISESSRLAFYVEKNITAKLRFTWNLWSLDLRRTFLDDTTPSKQGKFIPSEQRIVTIGPLIDYDMRDNPFLPTKGYLLRWDLDYSSPDVGSSDKIEFFRTTAQASKYFKIGKVVWANSLRGGYGKNLSDETDSGIPTSHVFFLGGLSTIRGFGGSGTYERIPNDVELPVTSGSNELLIDDSTGFYLIKSEFRFPIKDNIGAVLFYDAGEVRVSGINFEKPFRQAVGVGFRYNTPVGPVSLDLGFKIDPKTPLEDKMRIHFSFGTF